MEQISEKECGEMGLIFVEGDPAVRMKDAEKVTVSISLEGGYIYGAERKERIKSGKASDSEDREF